MFWRSKNKSLEALIESSSAIGFVSFFGKSTVPAESESYRFSQAITRSLTQAGYGVIHGGYAGGIMQAVADEAYKQLQASCLPLERNIAIPQKQHDVVGWPRVEHATFVDPAEDVFDRLRLMLSYSQFVIVGPRGGDGTMLELISVWHENVIAEALGKKPTPIVVLECKDGTNWYALLQNMVCKLDNGVENLEQIPWLHFCASEQDFTQYLVG